MDRRTKKRRGVILLVVLSLLAIFMLMATTFVIVSGTYRSAAAVSARLGARKPDPRELTHTAAMSVLVDTVDPRSSLIGHGLLRDMYGDDGFLAIASNVTILPPAPSNNTLQVGQFFDVHVTTLGEDYNGQPYSLSLTSGHYNGRVLTFVDGPAQGMSTRIVGYSPPTIALPGVFRFRVMPIEENTSGIPTPGSRLVINGRPFSGSGFGYNPLSATNDGFDPGPDGEWGVAGRDDNDNGPVDDYMEAGWAGSDDIPGTALQPNRQTFSESRTALSSYIWGGADESYDAADYQNMALAAMVPNPANPNRSFVLPSFHRPALINYWLQNVVLPEMALDMGSPPLPDQLLSAFLMPFGFDHLLGNADDPAFISQPMRERIVILKQRIVLRPLPEANPNFTGTNAAFTSGSFDQIAQAAVPHLNPYLAGPWDIDNDGDGDTDSLWIDTGMPILENSHGQLYKPLVAILCMDMDGRLNLNAHGGQGHLVLAREAAAATPTGEVIPPTDLAGELDAVTGIRLVPGIGTGPADINPSVLFSTLYERILEGDLSGRIAGRLGADDRPGQPGLLGINSRDVLAWTKFYPFPSNYHGTALDFGLNAHGAFESPSDLMGDLMVALDHRGQPSFTIRNTLRHLAADHPYEKNLLSRDPSDALFTVAELEALLRFNDTDVNPPDQQPVPKRLTRLVDTVVGGQYWNMLTSPAPRPPFPAIIPNNFFPPLNRRSLTTHSVDLPVPNMFEPPDVAAWNSTPAIQVFKPHWRNNELRFNSVSEILRARLIQNMGWAQPAFLPSWTNASTPEREQRLSALIGGMLSPDLRMGLRMDINRPFGNGRDDNNNGVVDEHGFGGPDAANRFRNLEASLWESGPNVLGPNANEGLWVDDDRFAVPFDHDNDGVTTGDQNAFLVRAHYARHLYILMMMFKDPNYFTSLDVDRDGIVGLADPADTSRLFAQWAVNAVDFRDADSINTPFEFDLTPFKAHPGPDGGWGIAGIDDDGINGPDDPGEAAFPGSDDFPPWGVDGVIGRRGPGGDGIFGNADDTDDTPNPDRALVWGTERPELLMTETLAYHDRRTEDRDDDNSGEFTSGGGGSDLDFDQRLKPEGSFYVELYNPWTSKSLRQPREFYNASRNGGVVLDKLTPVDPISPGATRSPVWRMLVVSSTAGHEGSPDFDAPYDATRSRPNDTDTVIYFGRSVGPRAGTARIFPDPTTPPTDPLITAPTDASRFAPLLGGRYAVVGTVRGAPMNLPDPANGGARNGISDWINPIGRRTDVSEGTLMPELTRRLVLQPHVEPNSNRVYVEDNHAAVALPNVFDPSLSSPPARRDALPPVALPIRNLNLTEELGFDYPPADTTTLDGEAAYLTPYDMPFDVAEYLTQDGMHLSGTSINGDLWDKVVHLQRLANPLSVWNPYPGEVGFNANLAVNPYLTVDTMPVDLASFNGISNDLDPVTTGSPIFGFYSRQRGELEPSGPGGVRSRILWRRDSLAIRPPRGATAALTVPHFFNVGLNHSLGYLNDQPDRFIYGPRFSNVTAPKAEYLGAPNTRAGNGPTFPWFNWLNRPFVSHYEMMQIPKSSSFTLLRDWAPVDPTRPKSTYDEREPAEFNHLLNFFSSSDPNAGAVPAANLARLFDFVHVPSQFVGTDTLLNPRVFGNPTVAPGTIGFRPPYNRVSKYREPGKVNMNTVYVPAVLDAIRGAPAPGGIGPLFRMVADSRRGFGERIPDPAFPSPPERRTDTATRWIQSGTQIPTFDPSSSNYDPVVNSVPTIFANPFRGFGDAALTPLPLRLTLPFIEGTMLRSNRIDFRDFRVPNAWPTTPAAPGADAPLFARTTGFAHNAPDRNTYFRYEAMQRFANLVTTRSNVYAVWVTVGFFEVENVGPTPLNPFGYRVGAEIGWDTGEVKRHRAFYVMDRSIPVAFEPGRRHNAEQAILLKRFIE